jgi:hypothetical protein
MAAEAEWQEKDGQRYKYEIEVPTREMSTEEAIKLGSFGGLAKGQSDSKVPLDGGQGKISCDADCEQVADEQNGHRSAGAHGGEAIAMNSVREHRREWRLAGAKKWETWREPCKGQNKSRAKEGPQKVKR